jgi:polysaccharide chain length determinant protein (PEP-CTERM system associated)
MDGLYEQFRIALHQVWRRRWLALAVAWGVCLLGWLAIALIPNSYKSTARVFVQTQNILPNQTGMNTTDRLADLLRVKQTLTSADNLAKVVRRTDLNQLVSNDRDVAAQAGALKENIKVTTTQDNLFEISATVSVPSLSNAQNAKIAGDVVQSLLDLFVEENLAGDRAETTQSLGFLDQELARRQQELQQAEQKRVEFEQRFLGLLPGSGSVEQRMAAARGELDNIEQRISEGQSSLAAMRGQLAATPQSLPGSSDNGGGGTASGQIAALQSQLAGYAARGWTDNHPDVIATRQQIDRLRPLAAREPRGAGGISNPAYVSLRGMVAEREGQVQAAIARRNQLQGDLAQLSSRQASEPGVAADQARLNRDYEVLKQQYDQLLGQREQVRLKNDVQNKTNAVQFRVIDPPSRSSVPEKPNRPLLLSVVLFVGLAAGVGAAFALGQLQTTFPTQSRLEQATGLPVLGAISEVLTAPEKARRRQRLIWLGGGASALAGGYAILMVVEFWQRSLVA